MPNITVNLSSPTGKTASPYLWGFCCGTLAFSGGPNDFSFVVNDAGFRASCATLQPSMIRCNTQQTQPQLETIFASGVNNPNWTPIDNWIDHHAGLFNDATGRFMYAVGPAFADTSHTPATYASWATAIANHFKSKGQECFWWEVGNEPDAGLGTANYVNYFTAIADALHTVNANYQVGGPASSFYDAGGYVTALIKNVPNSKIGFISYHAYGFPGNATPTPNQVYSQALGESIGTTVPRSQTNIPANIPLFMGEYNQLLDGGNNSTYTAALFSGLICTQNFKDDVNFGGNMLWDILYNSGFGAIGNAFRSGGSSSVIDPQGYYLGYAGQHMGGAELTVSGVSGNLQVLATKNGNNFAYQFINYDTSNPSSVNLTNTGGTPSGTITRWEIGKSNPNTPAISTQGSLSGINIPSEQIVILTGSLAAAQQGVISVNALTGTLPNTAFTVSGTLSNYSSAPTLSYKDDAGAATGFPVGSTITTTSYSFQHPGMSSGAHNLVITDGTISSIAANYTVLANTITVNAISNPLPNTAFTVTGSLANYSVAPTLTYSDDGLAAKALPTGSTVTATSFSFVHPGIQAGAHTLAVSSGSISGSASYIAIDTSWHSNVGVASPSTVSGLAPSVSYDFRVFATNSVGDGPVSAILTQVTSATAVIIPSAPTGLASSSISSTSVTVTWIAPATGTAPFSYLIQSAPAGSGSWVNGPTVTVLSAQITVLSASTSYDFRVFASNTAGSSPASTTFTTSTSAAPVTVTWQTTTKSAAIALSNANLTATATGSATAYSTYQSCFGTTSISSGKAAFEVTFTQLTQNASIGLANASYIVGTGGPATAQATTFYPSTGTGSQPPQSAYFNDTATLTPPGTPIADSAGATLTFCVDATARLWWVTGPAMRATYGSAAWNDSATANPATGVGGLPISVTGNLFILFDTEEGGAVAVLNAGSSAFSISVPSTFPAWNGQSTTTIIPGQVTGLTTGTPASTSIPLTWTDPSTGTQPFSYVVQSSLQGTGNWTTFGSVAVPLALYAGVPGDAASGNYPGFNAQWDGFTSTIGRSATLCVSFMNSDRSPTDGTFGWASQASFYSGQLKGNTRTVNSLPVIAWPFGYDSGSGSTSVAAAIAAGTHDALIQTCLGSWKANGFSTLYLRPAWEFNLPNQWAVPTVTTLANFLAAFQRFYTVVHNYATANSMAIKVIWNPNVGNNQNSAGLTVTQQYPGDSFVDILGIDTYGAPVDGGHPPTSTTTDTTQYLVSTMFNMAVSSNKHVAFCEVGGIDTTFANQMATVLNARATGIVIEFFSHFELDDSSGNLSWTNPVDNQATLAAIWRGMFGPGGSVTT